MMMMMMMMMMILSLFNLNLDFLQAVKATKCGHHLLHDRASKRYGSVPGAHTLVYSWFDVTNFFAWMLTKTYNDTNQFVTSTQE